MITTPSISQHCQKDDMAAISRNFLFCISDKIKICQNRQFNICQKGSPWIFLPCRHKANVLIIIGLSLQILGSIWRILHLRANVGYIILGITKLQYSGAQIRNRHYIIFNFFYFFFIFFYSCLVNSKVDLHYIYIE